MFVLMVCIRVYRYKASTSATITTATATATATTSTAEIDEDFEYDFDDMLSTPTEDNSRQSIVSKSAKRDITSADEMTCKFSTTKLANKVIQETGPNETTAVTQASTEPEEEPDEDFDYEFGDIEPAVVPTVHLKEQAAANAGKVVQECSPERSDDEEEADAFDYDFEGAVTEKETVEDAGKSTAAAVDEQEIDKFDFDFQGTTRNEKTKKNADEKEAQTFECNLEETTKDGNAKENTYKKDAETFDCEFEKTTESEKERKNADEKEAEMFEYNLEETTEDEKAKENNDEEEEETFDYDFEGSTESAENDDKKESETLDDNLKVTVAVKRNVPKNNIQENELSSDEEFAYDLESIQSSQPSNQIINSTAVNNSLCKAEVNIKETVVASPVASSSTDILVKASDTRKISEDEQLVKESSDEDCDNDFIYEKFDDDQTEDQKCSETEQISATDTTETPAIQEIVTENSTVADYVEDEDEFTYEFDNSASHCENDVIKEGISHSDLILDSESKENLPRNLKINEDNSLHVTNTETENDAQIFERTRELGFSDQLKGLSAEPTSKVQEEEEEEEEEGDDYGFEYDMPSQKDEMPQHHSQQGVTCAPEDTKIEGSSLKDSKLDEEGYLINDDSSDIFEYDLKSENEVESTVVKENETKVVDEVATNCRTENLTSINETKTSDVVKFTITKKIPFSKCLSEKSEPTSSPLLIGDSVLDVVLHGVNDTMSEVDENSRETSSSEFDGFCENVDKSERTIIQVDVFDDETENKSTEDPTSKTEVIIDDTDANFLKEQEDTSTTLVSSLRSRAVSDSHTDKADPSIIEAIPVETVEPLSSIRKTRSTPIKINRAVEVACPEEVVALATRGRTPKRRRSSSSQIPDEVVDMRLAKRPVIPKINEDEKKILDIMVEVIDEENSSSKKININSNASQDQKPLACRTRRGTSVKLDLPEEYPEEEEEEEEEEDVAGNENVPEEVSTLSGRGSRRGRGGRPYRIVKSEAAVTPTRSKRRSVAPTRYE